MEKGDHNQQFVRRNRYLSPFRGGGGIFDTKRRKDWVILATKKEKKEIKETRVGGEDIYKSRGEGGGGKHSFILSLEGRIQPKRRGLPTYSRFRKKGE